MVDRDGAVVDHGSAEGDDASTDRPDRGGHGACHVDAEVTGPARDRGEIAHDVAGPGKREAWTAASEGREHQPDDEDGYEHVGRTAGHRRTVSPGTDQD